MSERRRLHAFPLAILTLVPAILFFDVLIGSGSLYVRDVVHYHYPAKKILREIVLSGHFPWWNPFIHAGQPLAANPAHEVFYPLTWLILLPNYHFAFHLLALGHVVIACIAMYALLRSMRTGYIAATLGGLSFGVGGLVLSTLNLWPYLFSIAWLPLTCLFARRFLIDRRPRDFALAVLFFGIQLLIAEPTTVFQTGLLLGFYAIWRGMAAGASTGTTAEGGRRYTVLRNLGVVAAISVGALLLAAVQVIPAADHFADSVRSRGIPWSMVRTWSMPPARFAELVFPNFLGHAPAGDELPYWGRKFFAGRDSPFFFSIYSGLLVTALAAAGVLARQRGTALFLTVAGIASILAVGDHTPLLRWLYDLGAAGSTRYPEKFTIMLVFAIVVFGARTLDRLFEGDERVRKAALAFVAAVTIIAAAGLGITLLPDYATLHRRFFASPPNENVDAMLPLIQQQWFIAVARGLLLAIVIRNAARMRRRSLASILGAFVVLDLSAGIPDVAPRITNSFYEPPPAALRLPANRDDYRLFNLADWLPKSKLGSAYHARQRGRYWLLRNMLRPMTQATWGFRSVMETDFDMTTLRSTADFTSASLTLMNDDMRYLNHVAAMSNIWFVAVYRPFPDAVKLGGADVRRVEGVRWVEGQHYPRYYFATQVVESRTLDDFMTKMLADRHDRQAALTALPSFTPARGTVHSVREWPNGARLDVEAAGRAFLVMSVTAHKYWRVTIDGRETTALPTNIAYQGVLVPPGRHVVEMRYRNPLVIWGAALSLLALIALIYGVRRRQSPLALNDEGPLLPRKTINPLECATCD